jgi:MFS family permease
LPFSIFKVRVVGAAVVTGFFTGAVMFGVIAFVPLFVQGVLGGDAKDAGFALAPMAIGWPLGSTLSGRLLLRLGYRASAVLGTLLFLGGSLLATRLGPATPRLELMTLMFLVGTGLGFCTTTFVVSLQTAVGWEQRGLATAVGAFFRTIGGTVGVGALGAFLVSRLRHALPTSSVDPNWLLSPVKRAALGGELASMTGALAGALHGIFVILVGLSLISVLSALAFPGGAISGRDLAPPRDAGPRQGS